MNKKQASNGSKEKVSRKPKQKSSIPPSDADVGNKDDRPCNGCKGVVDENTKALQCEFCAIWFCLVCSDVPEVVYDLAKLNKIPGFVWTCNSCIHAIPTFKNIEKVMNGVKDEQVTCRADIDKLNVKVEKLEDSIEDKVYEAVEEYRNRESRKCNIILHQIAESDKEDSKDRKAHDTKMVHKVLAAIEVEDVEIQSVVRLGKRDPFGDRLMKVSLGSVKQKSESLRNAKKLRNTNKWKEVYITPDMTPKEREQSKILRAELKRRREEGEERLVIRRGKIIQLDEKSYNARPSSESKQKVPNPDPGMQQVEEPDSHDESIDSDEEEEEHDKKKTASDSKSSFRK